MTTPSALAIVTGASSGIGAALARQLSARGQPVLAIGRRAHRLEELCAQACAAGHAPIHPLELDVTTEGAALRVRDRARALGGAAWLVNNAGTTRLGPFLDGDPAAQAMLVRLNCESVVALCAAIVPDLVARGGGRVLNVASLAAFQPTPGHAVYGATKAFVLSFSESLAVELDTTGVTVTALCPGPVTTEIFDAGAPGVSRRKPPFEISAEECAAYGIAAADRGDVVAVPTALSKATAQLSRILPRAALRRLSARIGLSILGYGGLARGARR
ncbi:ketoacyl reductase [Sorangium cellulosum]|uniref:Ketoacyl reductase n=1 Tax=Sorangium cellulosum TaxID=56 RepID=A0A4P2Q076_SORCE|nr:SDR family NAD(P)-dependent oxidoreductase [Sorangium cellulosum]AUX22604.1 ketoacyl reductase [Sorangium cellulosum]